MFIDNFYIYFDYEKKGLIKIILKSKNKITSKKFKITIGNFYNELIFQYLRLDIFTNTKNLREIIVGRALYGTSFDLSNYENMNNKPDSIEFFNDKDIHLKETEDYQVDPYDIASDWFENLDKEN
jgi:His-Xaa-Ser system protein HxsD